MIKSHATPSGHAADFNEDEIIVSKTDLRGVITYANDVFQRVSGYREAELIGQPHNIIRHPDMPRCIFKLLWDTVQEGREIFAYVLNLAKNGDHYWVFAHVTPSRDKDGKIVGYHSNRRVPYPDALEAVIPLHAQLCEVERRHADPREGLDASSRILCETFSAGGQDYSEFVFGLSKLTRLESAV